MIILEFLQQFINLRGISLSQKVDIFGQFLWKYVDVAFVYLVESLPFLALVVLVGAIYSATCVDNSLQPVVRASGIFFSNGFLWALIINFIRFVPIPTLVQVLVVWLSTIWFFLLSILTALHIVFVLNSYLFQVLHFSLLPLRETPSVFVEFILALWFSY